MGNFYTSLTVRGADRDDVVQAMKGRTAAISPTFGEYTVVWDEECEKQDQAIIERLSLQLSKQVSSPVLAVLNHDDDILWYILCSPEEKLDEYNSAPGYFEGNELPPAGGNAHVLAKAIAVNASEENIRRVLQNTEYVFASERHSALLKALGMPMAACTGYKYIAGGKLPPGVAGTDMVFTA